MVSKTSVSALGGYCTNKSPFSEIWPTVQISLWKIPRFSYFSIKKIINIYIAKVNVFAEVSLKRSKFYCQNHPIKFQSQNVWSVKNQISAPNRLTMGHPKKW